MKDMEEKLQDDKDFRLDARLSRMPLHTYWTQRLYNFIQRKGTEEACQAALDYISGKVNHFFLTFVGPPGTGKTHLALGIGWHYLEVAKITVRYWQVETLLDDMRAGFNRGWPERDNYDLITKGLRQVPLLILDDLGVEQHTDWSRAKLNEIIDWRYVGEKMTVVTSNVAPDKLGDMIASRLKEGRISVLKSDDYRIVKAKLRGQCDA